MEKTVACVVVTFNKLEFLKRNLNCLQQQTQKINNIIVVDNASSDNTQEYMEKYSNEYVNTTYYKLKENIGGAGGFNFGIKKAYDTKADFIWIMDDDTMPNEDALEKLFRADAVLENNWGFLCSNVRWVDNSPCVMNIPVPSNNWNDKIINGLVKCDYATFVSFLVKRECVKEFGLPIKDFFIWGDDTEYSGRISKKYNSYMVNDSIVIHEMAINNDINILRDSVDRFPRYFYRYRNKVYTFRKNNKEELIKFTGHTLKTCFLIAFTRNNRKIRKISIILKGYFKGFIFNPKIEKV